MNRDDIIRLAHEAGIIPWEQMEWSNNRFVLTDEGMDGDLACLMQFAALVAAAEREACAKVCEDLPVFGSYRDLQTATLEDAAAAIRARGEK